MKSRTATGLMILLAVLVSFGALAAETTPSTNQIRWYTYEDGAARARQSGRSMVIYFYADWCTYCTRMQKETFTHPSVIDFMNDKVVAVKVNVDAEKALARTFGVRGLPATILVTRSGDPVGPLPGFIPAKSYLAMLTRIMEQSS